MNTNLIAAVLLLTFFGSTLTGCYFKGKTEGRHLCEAAHERAAAIEAGKVHQAQAQIETRVVTVEVERQHTNSITRQAVQEATHAIEIAPDTAARLAASHALDQRLRDEAAADNAATIALYLGSLDAGGYGATGAAG